MASVSVIFKVYPKDGQLEQAVADIKTLSPKGYQTEEIGFGIKFIKVLFTFDDKQSSSAVFEEKMKAFKSVSEVEVEEESLI
jgi:translation elongation factor EF-1beta